MCQCRNAHITYMSCLPYMYDNDVPGNNKLQANLWRSSMELGRWKITLGGCEKKASTNKLKFFRIPTWLSNYPLRVQGCLGFRVWLSNYPLSWDCCNFSLLNWLHSSSIPWLLRKWQATQLRIPGEHRRGPRLSFDHRNHRSHYNALRSVTSSGDIWQKHAPLKNTSQHQHML